MNPTLEILLVPWIDPLRERPVVQLPNGMPEYGTPPPSIMDPIKCIAFVGRANYGRYLLRIGWAGYPLPHKSDYTRYFTTEHKGMLTDFKLVIEDEHEFTFGPLIWIGENVSGDEITPQDNMGTILLSEAYDVHPLPGGPRHKTTLLNQIVNSYGQRIGVGDIRLLPERIKPALEDLRNGVHKTGLRVVE